MTPTLPTLFAAVAAAALLLSSSVYAEDAAKPAAPAKEKTAHKTEKADAKPKGFATEAAAEAGCKGATVIWAGGDGMNHYKGSREYGKKPGTFACER
jgi:hypothetical protein